MMWMAREWRVPRIGGQLNMSVKTKHLEQEFTVARERCGEWGVDVDRAIGRLSGITISLHCWQGDDIAGFEGTGEEIGGGLAVTGKYLGRARTPDELRADLDKALALLPGTHRLNLHASYAETGGRRVGRDELQPRDFPNWN